MMDSLEALHNLLEHYVDMVKSGDCGNWDPEKEQVVVDARAVLAQQPPEKEPSPRYTILREPTYCHVRRGGRYRIVEAFYANVDPIAVATGLVDLQTLTILQLRSGERLLWNNQTKPAGHANVLGRAILQTAKPIVKGGWWVWYRNEDGTDWLRTPDEFFDGRFTMEA